MSFKTEREQRLAVQLFAERLTLLDNIFLDFIANNVNGENKFHSLKELIELKTEAVHEDLIFTEMIFHKNIDLPYIVKSSIIKEFSEIFRI